MTCLLFCRATYCFYGIATLEWLSLLIYQIYLLAMNDFLSWQLFTSSYKAKANLNWLCFKYKSICSFRELLYIDYHSSLMQLISFDSIHPSSRNDVFWKDIRYVIPALGSD